MTQVKNLGSPLRMTHDVEHVISGRVENDEIVIRYGLEGGGGVEVFRVAYHHKMQSLDTDLREFIAQQIATAIRDAHRLGFNQGRRFVQDALGIETLR